MDYLTQYLSTVINWTATLYTPTEWFVLITLILCVVSIIETAKRTVFLTLKKETKKAAIYGVSFLLGPILVYAASVIIGGLSDYFIFVWSLALGQTANGIFFIASKEYKKRASKE